MSNPPLRRGIVRYVNGLIGYFVYKLYSARYNEIVFNL